MHFWRGPEGTEAGVYRDRDDLFADLTRIYRDEIAELAALGATYVQLDEVPLAMLCDPAVRDAVAARGEDPEALVALYVEAINAALASRPISVTVALHLCRGNYKGKWISAGGYAPVAERLFRDARVDAFFLEYDSARAGDFEPLRSVPEPKVVVLGLVSTKQAEIESRAGLIWRIREAGRMMPLERLAVSPQCGFASTVAGNPVTEDIERAKLACIVETAREVWG
jgi:5-methyltetrahydropteroyltriglutamate--homocysteine methyltransferase